MTRCSTIPLSLTATSQESSSVGQQEKQEQTCYTHGCGKENLGDGVTLQRHNNENIAERAEREKAHSRLMGAGIRSPNGRPESGQIYKGKNDDGPYWVGCDKLQGQSGQCQDEESPVRPGDNGVDPLLQCKPGDVYHDTPDIPIGHAPTPPCPES